MSPRECVRRTSLPEHSSHNGCPLLFTKPGSSHPSGHGRRRRHHFALPPLIRMLRAAILIISVPFAAHAQTNDDPAKALQLITDTADRICNVVASSGRSDTSEVQGQVKAELGGLASRLANVGISGSGKLDNENYQNVLRQDLATTLRDNAACKLKVFDTLQSRLLPNAPSAGPSRRPAPETSPDPVLGRKNTPGTDWFAGTWARIPDDGECGFQIQIERIDADHARIRTHCTKTPDVRRDKWSLFVFSDGALVGQLFADQDRFEQDVCTGRITQKETCLHQVTSARTAYHYFRAE
jgi:hypothetical protein